MLIPVGLVCSRVCSVGLRAGYEILWGNFPLLGN